MALGEIEEFTSEFGREKYRAKQIMKWLYQSGPIAFHELTNLSKNFRTENNNFARICSIMICKIQQSVDEVHRATAAKCSQFPEAIVRNR